MNVFLKTGSVILMICSCEQALRAQIDLTKLEIGIDAGAFVYQGDLTPSRLGSYRTMKPIVGAYVNRILSPMFSLRTDLAFGKLKGDDAKYSVPPYRQQRNFKFTSPVVEVSELLVADLFRNNMAREKSSWSPYLFAGAGVSILRIRRDWSGFNAEYFSAEQSTIDGLATDARHAMPTVIPVLPAGVGVRYTASQKLSVSAETSYRFTFTDYLDGFSKAADPARKDSYQSHSIGIIYQFLKNNSWWKCPVPKY
jgi:hypothetical protein